MLRSNNEKKDKINILLNPDNFYGKHSGDMVRVLLYCVAVALPFLGYSMLFSRFVPLRFFLPVFILYALRMALIIIGREKERKTAYLKALNDEYASAKELIKIADVHDDGLIEYQNGYICYIIKGYGYSYMNDDKFSKDVEEFLTRLTRQYEVDVYGHLVVNELETSQSDLEKLHVYKDLEFLKERLEFYKYQDRYTNDNSMLYRLNFVVRSYKTNWGRLKKDVDIVVTSEFAQCFDYIKVCDREEAINVVSRDICLYVDIGEMLRTKHSSDDYFGSKVLYFGDEVPDSLKPVMDNFEDEDRRVIDVI